MKGKKLVLVALVGVFAFSGLAFAQGGRFDDSGDRPTRKRDRIHQRIELMKMWRLTEALELDQETAAKLFPVLREQEEKERKLRDNGRDILKEMKAELDKEEPDSRALSKLTKQYMQNERDIVDFRGKRLDELSKFLSEEQIAQMMLFVPRFERDMREMICEARMKHMQRRTDRKEGRPWDSSSRPSGPPWDYSPSPDAQPPPEEK